MSTKRSNRYLASRKKVKGEDDPKVIFIDMPEVRDIPGQEKIRPPRMREMMDTTLASDGEEGKGIVDGLNRDNYEDALMDDSSNVTEEEIALLDASDRPVNEETKDRRKLALDKTDGDTQLNESGSPDDLGEDLDIPGSDLDDERIGEEDEENNGYSRPD
ncbi:MAG TPA: hypothetical protein VFV68_13500 [Agriterribacter sp.]|nr:hypothetical protein [Agriterribacter sp.]